MESLGLVVRITRFAMPFCPFSVLIACAELVANHDGPVRIVWKIDGDFILAGLVTSGEGLFAMHGIYFSRQLEILAAHTQIQFHSNLYIHIMPMGATRFLDQLRKMLRNCACYLNTSTRVICNIYVLRPSRTNGHGT